MFGFDNADHPRLYRVLNEAMLPYTRLSYEELRAHAGERARLAAPGDPPDVKRISLRIRQSARLSNAIEVVGSIRPDGPAWLARPAHEFVMRSNGWTSGTVHEGDELTCRVRLPGDPEPPAPEDYLAPPIWMRIIGHGPMKQVLIGLAVVAISAVAGIITLIVAAVRALS